MDQAKGSNKKVIAALAVLVLIAIMVFGAKALSSQDSKVQTAASGTTESVRSGDTASTSQPADTPAKDNSSAYKDGSYEAAGNYRSPGGDQSIRIKVTLQDGKVTDTSAESGAVDGTSRDFQSKFISAYKDQVVGKKLDEVNLDRVSGSSLTPQGFNDAIDKIKASAKV